MREWFEAAFAQATPAQAQAWPAIASGEHVLVSAPTGSGKTLAAFLWGLDRLVVEPSAERGTRLVYVSPLKALSYDIERNLRAPLKGIGGDVRVAIRTGDTPQRERQRMLKDPPDILITTPESLYLMLTSRARETLRSAEWVIVDEIHAVAATKRGAHLALTLERLDALVREEGRREPQRIGLSATQTPLAEVARFLVGPQRECRIVDVSAPKSLDVKVHVPVESMTELHGVVHGDSDQPLHGSIWPAIYPELLRLIREHNSTIVFVNSRRSAERLALRLNELAAAQDEAAHGDGIAGDEEGAPAAARGSPRPAAPPEIARAHHGSLAREERLVVEELLKAGEIPCIVATSSLELGIDMGAVDLVLQVESPKSVAAGLQRIGRAGHGVGEVSRGRIFPKFRADLLECAVLVRRMREGAIEPTVVPRNPLDVLAQQIVAMAASEQELAVEELYERVRRTHSYSGAAAPTAGGRVGHARRALPLRRVWGAAPADRVGPPRGHDPPAQRRARAGGGQRGHDPRPRAVPGDTAGRTAGGRARRGDGLRGTAGAGLPAGGLGVADRGDRPRSRDRHACAGSAGDGAVLEG